MSRGTEKNEREREEGRRAWEEYGVMHTCMRISLGNMVPLAISIFNENLENGNRLSTSTVTPFLDVYAKKS